MTRRITGAGTYVLGIVGVMAAYPSRLSPVPVEARVDVDLGAVVTAAATTRTSFRSVTGMGT